MIKIELGKELIEKNIVFNGCSYKIEKYKIMKIFLDYKEVLEDEKVVGYEIKEKVGVIREKSLVYCRENNCDIENYIVSYDKEKIDSNFVESVEEYNKYFKDKINERIDEELEKVEKLKEKLKELN